MLKPELLRNPYSYYSVFHVIVDDALEIVEPCACFCEISSTNCNFINKSHSFVIYHHQLYRLVLQQQCANNLVNLNFFSYSYINTGNTFYRLTCSWCKAHISLSCQKDYFLPVPVSMPAAALTQVLVLDNIINRRYPILTRPATMLC